MNLKDFLASREKAPDLYWSLVVEKDWVQAGIWYVNLSSTEMLNISPPAAWKEDSELVGACDAALSSCISALPENYQEPNKTVFGVPSKWVKDGEISDEYLAQIKTVCTELSLVPVGFVVLPEAIAHLYKAEEGTPLSAVVIGLGSEFLEVSVFKLGNLLGTTSVARSISLTDDVEEGLSRFEGAQPLPSRIIIYDGKGGELEDAKEELMKSSWDSASQVKFLHTPKAEILVSDKKVLATSLAGANEIADVTSVNEENIKTAVSDSKPENDEIQNITEPEEEISAADLGFVLDSDIAKSEEPAPVGISTETQNRPGVVTAETYKQPPTNKRLSLGKYLNSTKNILHGFSSKVNFSGNVFGFAKTKRIFLGISAVILGLIVGLGLYLWFVPKADVTVYVLPKTFQEQIPITFNLDGKFDESGAIVPGVALTASSTGEKTKSTTGSKLVGDKATGSVQVANGNGNPIRLAAGTILTSSSGLKFVTNSEASVSGQLIPGSPGTATLSVTAYDIGSQYNLPKGEVFKVGLFEKSQVAATSLADFSGGSSQQIAAVSAEDQKKLEIDLKNELSSKVLANLEEQVKTDQIFVNDLSSLSVDSQSFDRKVGDVSDTLKLSLTVTGNGIAANKEKFLQYVINTLKSKIPQGYALRSSHLSYRFKFVTKQDGNLSYNADISANFIPLINKNSVAKNVAGKKKDAVSDELSNIPGFSRAEIKLSPTLPEPLKFLPRNTKNIKIDVVPEQ